MNPIFKGENHHFFKGEKALKSSQRLRAVRAFKNIGKCERCKTKKATDRHHINSDTNNNDRSNLMFLCRKCHMIEDGRLLRLTTNPNLYGRKTPDRPCIICLKPSFPLRKRRCHKCNEFLRRHGFERPAVSNVRKYLALNKITI